MNTIILIGLPASGKSTYAEKIKNNNTIVLSSDSIRKEIYGDESIQGNPKEIFDTLYSRMRLALSENKDVIVDATNINIRDRSLSINIAKEFNSDIEAVVFETPIEECKKRNLKRKRVVPDFVYDRMSNKYEEPTLKEGFNIITTIF